MPSADEAWIATTCYLEFPDTSGWRRYQFADVSIAVPAEYTMTRRVVSPGIRSELVVSEQNPRTLFFSRGTAELSLSVSSSTLPAIYLAGRRARATKETACESPIGGYPGTVSASVEGRRYSVSAAWHGWSFWNADDWRKQLTAGIGATRLRDATVLRQALHTIHAVRDSVP